MAHFNPKRVNANPLYRFIWEQGPISRSDLQKITGLKLTTLARKLDQLLAQQYIQEVGEGQSSGGRKPVLYQINPQAFSIIGIDLSRTSLKIGLMDLKSHILDMQSCPMDKETNPDKTIDWIAEIIGHFDIKYPLLGIGIGSVGPIDCSKGMLLNPAHFLSEGWMNVPLAKRLEELVHQPVFMESGANCAVLGEYYYGAGKGYRSIGYIHIGRGIRSGMLNHGHLVRPAADRDDVLGHMTIDMDGEKCYCGSFGCLEKYCSTIEMTEKFKNYLKRGRDSAVLQMPGLDIDDISFYHLSSAAIDGDALAREVILNGAGAFGIGLANYVNLLDLDMVVISGPAIQQCDLFYQESIRVAEKKTLRPVDYTKSNLGGNAIMKGAGLKVMSHYFIGGVF